MMVMMSFHKQFVMAHGANSDRGRVHFGGAETSTGG